MKITIVCHRNNGGLYWQKGEHRMRPEVENNMTAWNPLPTSDILYHCLSKIAKLEHCSPLSEFKSGEWDIADLDLDTATF